ncbi:glycosyltransferase family 9 protein [Puniceicoccaceae bacterium K14]|nr:glycosyltransferase family 9 protein [Puniceicoccaceae bacterium K14]
MLSNDSNIRILIVKTSSLGDIMHGLRVAQSIKDRLPNVEIDWVARRKYVATVKASSVVNRVFTFYRHDGVRAFFALVRDIRKHDYDYIFDMEGLARSALIGWFGKASVKVGRSDAREGATLFYRKMIPMPERSRQKHPIDILLEFCRVLGLGPELGSRAQFDFGTSANDSTMGEGAPLEIALCDLSPTTNDPFYDLESLVEAFVNSSFDCKIILLGDEESESRSDWGYEAVDDLRGKLSLEDRVLRVSNASLVISSPGGPLHIASACEIPVIGLFGRLNPSICGPYPVNGDRSYAISFANRPGPAVIAEVLEKAEKLLSE